MSWAIERKVKKIITLIEELRIANMSLNNHNIFHRKVKNRNTVKIIKLQSELNSIFDNINN